MKLPTPTVHLNGSGARALIDAACNVAQKLHEAQEAMRLAWPHGRDYYTQGPSAYQTANTAWSMMEAQLNDMIFALGVYAGEIDKQ